MTERSDTTVVLIGIFRLAKAAALIALGVAALLGGARSFGDALSSAVDRLGLAWAQHLLDRGLERLFALPPRAIREIGVACLAYATIFTVEGIGLVLRRHWAEWVTVVVTSSFVPFELYELVRHPTVGKALFLAVNVVIVIYLVARIVRRRRAH
ncbi:MAG TPA: DUF2127 domain-containing protein [Polyangia bacterium]|nr:DUF2127 domain-containing protein [Polyangia bacterium]